MKTFFSVAIAATLLFAVGGCGDTFGGCTEQGCTHMTILTFENSDGEPIEGFSGDITADGETISVTCNADGSGSGPKYECDPSGEVWLRITGVDEFSLNVRDADESTSFAYVGSVAVTYNTLRPNGPGCEPICQQASKTVTMEPTQADGS